MTMFQRASQVFWLLAGAAKERKTYTYSNIQRFTGMDRRGIGQPLGPITVYCKVNELPLLTVLAVNATTGAPWGHFYDDIEDINSYREQVFNFDWFKIPPPQTDDFEAVYKSHSHLLEKQT